MEKYSYKEFSLQLEKKLSHNFGITPEQASDEFFYKACVLVLLDVMRERKALFQKATDDAERPIRNSILR